MKLIYSLIPAYTYATVAQMAADFYKLQIINRGEIADNSIKAFTDIDGYGCWCYFEDDHGLGRSHPVNKIDETCKGIHDGYTCAIKDHGNTVRKNKKHRSKT